MESIIQPENSEEVAGILAEHPLLAGLAPVYIQEVVDSATRVSFEAGAYLLHEGETANEFYLIRAGKVAVGVERAPTGFATIQILGQDEIVGWSWLMPPHAWRFAAKAITPVQVIALDGKRLRDKCEADHEFGYELLNRLGLIIGQRLKATKTSLV